MKSKGVGRAGVKMEDTKESSLARQDIILDIVYVSFRYQFTGSMLWFFARLQLRAGWLHSSGD